MTFEFISEKTKWDI